MSQLNNYINNYIRGSGNLNYDTVKALLEKGESPNYVPPGNTFSTVDTVIFATVVQGKIDPTIFSLLLKHGANQYWQHGLPFLFTFLCSTNTMSLGKKHSPAALARIVLDFGGNPNVMLDRQNFCGMNFPSSTTIINACAQVFIHRFEKIKALFLHSLLNKNQTVEALISAFNTLTAEKAVESSNRDDYLPWNQISSGLRDAMNRFNELPDFIETLIAHGANVDSKDTTGKSALDYLHLIKPEELPPELLRIYEKMVRLLEEASEQKRIRKEYLNMPEFKQSFRETMERPGGLKERAIRATRTGFKTDVDKMENLCSDLENSLYKNELYALAIELGLPVTKRTTKREICNMIAEYGTYRLISTHNENR